LSGFVLGMLSYIKKLLQMAGSDDHIKHLRLFDLARQSGNPMSDEEREHLRACEECQRILQVFARQRFDKPIEKPEDAA
jgi:hypothetical protein